MISVTVTNSVTFSISSFDMNARITLLIEYSPGVFIPQAAFLVYIVLFGFVGDLHSSHADAQKTLLSNEIVPTVDSVRYSFLMALLLLDKHPVLLTGMAVTQGVAQAPYKPRLLVLADIHTAIDIVYTYNAL